MIDTITFDLWNTLLSNRPQDNEKYRHKRLEAIRGLLQQSGFGVDLELLHRAHDQGFEKCKEIWKRNLDLDTREQLHIMFSFLEDQRLKALPQTLMRKLEKVFLAPILEDPPRLVEGARRTVEHAQSEGYKIGLICNTGRTPGRTLRELLKKLDMIRYFGALTFSNELKIRKPDPQIFFHALSQLKSDPANSVHVGDDLKVDVLGAKRIGMVSVHFDPDQGPHAEIQPDFSVKQLTELKAILQRIKRSFSDVNN